MVGRRPRRSCPALDPDYGWSGIVVTINIGLITGLDPPLRGFVARRRWGAGCTGYSMPTFTYKAMTADGENVDGALTAENRQAVMRMLDDRALFPVRIDEGGAAQKMLVGTGKRKVKLRYLTVFYQQMADLLRAGVPLLRSLDVLARQDSNPILTEVIREVREDVAGGHTLADAMEKHPNAFTTLHVSMIRAGESGGFLEEVLLRIAGFAERQDELRNKLMGSMIYPCILVIAGMSVTLFLMTVVVPKLRPFLRDDSLNVLTRLVFGVCDVLLHHGYLVLGIVVGLVFAAAAYLRTERGRWQMERFKLRAPVLGPVFTMVALCRFCRILGTLLKNGVAILQALKISKNSAGNDVLAAEIDKAHDSVVKGEDLARPLAASGLFPPDIIDMIAVAEESNNLENVLVQIADTNEARTARKIDISVRLLEPILLVLMAGVVMVIAMALLLPILTVSAGSLAG